MSTYCGGYTCVSCFSWEIFVLIIFGLLVGVLARGVALGKVFTYRGYRKHRKDDSSVTGSHWHRIRALFTYQRIKIRKTLMNSLRRNS
jgi:hypothetical protein